MGQRRGSLAAVRRVADKLPSSCKDHPASPAAARCESCARGLCDLCFRFTIDRRPACARCAYEASTRPQRRVSLAIVFLLFAAAMIVWVTRRFSLWPDDAAFLVLGGAATVVIAGYLALSARKEKRHDVEARDDEVLAESADAAQPHPYRVAARRVLLAAAPRVSGKASAAIVLACLVAAAVLVPASLRLPRWIEVEIVLVAWWLVLATLLVVLLYRDFRLRDDYVYFVPWDRPSVASARPAMGGGSGTSGWSIGDGCSADGEGIVVAAAVAIVLGAAFGAAWVVVELALPLVFFVLYAGLMRAIRRVAADRRGCAGDLGKSLAWGALWATIYIAPISLLTWAIHALHR